MPDKAGTRDATGEGVTEVVTEVVIALPHGGLVTVQFNSYLVIEHKLTQCVWCANLL